MGLCYKYYPAPRSELHLYRLAVPRKYRGQGHAGTLTRWFLDWCTRVPQSQAKWVTLSAFDTVVDFYRRFGFVATGSAALNVEGGDPQTWMQQPNISVIARNAPTLIDESVQKNDD